MGLPVESKLGVGLSTFWRASWHGSWRFHGSSFDADYRFAQADSISKQIELGFLHDVTSTDLSHALPPHIQNHFRNVFEFF
jgi:hypothetical protein